MNRRQPVALVPLALLAGLVLMPAVGPSSTVAGKMPVPDVALVTASGRVLEVRDSRVTADRRGLVTADERTVVTWTADGDRTTITWTDLATGDPAGELTVDGKLRIAAAEMSGAHVVLVNRERTGPSTPTDVVLVSRERELMRHRYPELIEPEGVSSAEPGQAPTHIFVLKYLAGAPGARPTYQVRSIDVASTTLSPPFDLRSKTPIEQTMSADYLGRVTSMPKSMIFSLYRGTENGAEEEEAFVHALSTWGGVWCLDLPEELDLLRRPGALAVAASGERLLIASANGRITEVSVDRLLHPERAPVPERTLEAWEPVDPDAVVSMAARGRTVLVAQQRAARWIDLDQPGRVERLTLQEPVEAVGIIDDTTAVGATATGVVVIDHAGAWGSPLAELAGDDPVVAVIPIR